MNRDYVIALYLRISDEERNDYPNLKEESSSITGQRQLLRDAVAGDKELAGSNIVEFCDDGYSGTNFERPGFQEMIRQAEEGTIHCIVVKDFSRLGRNYLETGRYLEQIFPLLGIRVLAVNDHFDSTKNFGAAGSIEVGFKNIVFEAYSRDLSVKITSVKRARAGQGKFVTAFAPYGYQKSENGGEQLVVDQECAPVVRKIFTLFLSGVRQTEIAEILNRKKIPSPMMVKKSRGEKLCGCKTAEQCCWNPSTISRILGDERYTGTAVYGKSVPETMGSGRSVRVPEETWIKVPDSFEEIISKEEFLTVQQRRRRYQVKKGYLQSDSRREYLLPYDDSRVRLPSGEKGAGKTSGGI